MTRACGIPGYHGALATVAGLSWRRLRAIRVMNQWILATLAHVRRGVSATLTVFGHVNFLADTLPYVPRIFHISAQMRATSL